MNTTPDLSILKSRTAIIILAAGSSSRMGTSKQLLKIDDTELLRKTALTALNASVKQICVVLGSNASEHRKTIEDLSVDFVVNHDWKNGMGGSVKVGFDFLMNSSSEPQAVIVLVCDQPLLTDQHILTLIQKQAETGKGIIASKYDDSVGVPALFAKTYFRDMTSLSGDQGAKKIIRENINDVETVDFEGGGFDLDTMEDYQKFLNQNMRS